MWSEFPAEEFVFVFQMVVKAHNHAYETHPRGAYNYSS